MTKIVSNIRLGLVDFAIGPVKFFGELNNYRFKSCNHTILCTRNFF